MVTFILVLAICLALMIYISLMVLVKAWLDFLKVVADGKVTRYVLSAVTIGIVLYAHYLIIRVVLFIFF